jgi:hypothetical protein
MRLLATYRGPEAQRFAEEPAPYGAGWAEVANIAQTILVYESEPDEPGERFYLLLAYDGEGNEVGRKRVDGWGEDGAEGLRDDSSTERRWVCLL